MPALNEAVPTVLLVPHIPMGRMAEHWRPADLSPPPGDCHVLGFGRDISHPGRCSVWVRGALSATLGEGFAGSECTRRMLWMPPAPLQPDGPREELNGWKARGEADLTGAGGIPWRLRSMLIHQLNAKTAGRGKLRRVIGNNQER